MVAYLTAMRWTWGCSLKVNTNLLPCSSNNWTVILWANISTLQEHPRMCRWTWLVTMQKWIELEEILGDPSPTRVKQTATLLTRSTSCSPCGDALRRLHFSNSHRIKITKLTYSLRGPILLGCLGPRVIFRRTRCGLKSSSQEEFLQIT